MEALAREGLEIPYEIRVAGEVTLSDRLLHGVNELQRDFKGVVKRGEIDRIIDEAKEHGFQLSQKEPTLILNEMLNQKMRLLQKAVGSDLSRQEEEIGEMITLLDQTEKWGFELSKEEAQDLMDEVLDESIGTLEKSWWGEGIPKPLHPHLVILAEKLGFNMKRVSEMIREEK